MKKRLLFSHLTPLLLVLILAAGLVFGGCGAKEIFSALDDAASAVSTEAVSASDSAAPSQTDPAQDDAPDEDAWLYEKDDVARYLEIYGTLPQNYITKSEAREMGWIAEEGNLWDVADGMCIGGDVFGNREGLLPEKSGRVYYECDVDYDGGFRSSHRLVFSNDGLIYYTEDHYEHFTLILEP